MSAHLKPEAAAGYWADIDLDLTEAHLHQLDLSGCHIRYAGFSGATFTGITRFVGATFDGHTGFNRATFTRETVFSGATFTGEAWFREATFDERADFSRATFKELAGFLEATFDGKADFGRATFTGPPGFFGATFTEAPAFDGARAAPFLRAVFPRGWTTRAAAQGEEEGLLYLVRDEDSSEQPTEAPGDGPA